MPDPITQFQSWFAAAGEADLPLPDAASLSTATADGRPSSRMVLVKLVDERGFVFYTNYGSRKARELDANPHAALLWFWPQLERQILVEGPVSRITTEESDAYFRTRPLGSRIGAWASRQSENLESREELETAVAKFEQKFGDDPPLPPFWGGYRLDPMLLEFWQGRPDRLHDRTLYERSGDTWTMRRLNP